MNRINSSSNQDLLADIFSGLDLSSINNNRTYNTNDNIIQDQPNYLKQTFCSTLPSTSYEEVDRIRNSFRTGSYWSIKKLPSKFAAGNINNIRKHHTQQNLSEKPENVFHTVATKSFVGNERGCFEQTKYVSLDYEKVADLHKGNVQAELNQVDSLGRRPFKTKMRAPIKSEDQFGDPIISDGTMTSAASTGIVLPDKIFRADFTDGDKFKHGPFYLYFKKNGEVSRHSVEKWTPALFKQLQKDWSHLKFKVKFTTDDEMLIQFYVGKRTKNDFNQATISILDEDKKYKDDINANINTDVITRYMNRLVTHGLASDFNLSKRGDRWGSIEVIKNILNPDNNNNNENNENIDNKDDDTIQELYLTYSLFPPWQTKGPVLAAKSAMMKSKSNRIQAKRNNT